MAELYRAAVIGLGRIGWTMEADPKRPKPATHVGAWLACPRAKLVGVADINADRLADVEWSTDTTDHDVAFERDLDSLLREVRSVDVVSVATPPDTHRALVEQCAAAGIRVIVCEKPLALTARDCRAMIAACKEAGASLFVNHSRRFDPTLRAAAANVPERLGEIVNVVAYHSGGLWNSGPHMVDLIRMMTRQEIGSVFGFSEAAPFGPSAMLELAPLGRLVALMAHDVDDYAIFDLHVYGRRGALHITDSGYCIAWDVASEHRQFSGYQCLKPVMWELREAGAVPRSFLAPMAEHVCDVLDGAAEPVSTGEDGLAAVRVLEALSGA